MISIIICSKSPSLLKAVSASIEKTIGVPFEIIAIENKDGKYGICKAYNMGAAKAIYNTFCFMHEDVSFETLDWGKYLLKHLEDKTIGLVGVAGIDHKAKVPTTVQSKYLSIEINIIQVNLTDGKDVHLFQTQTPNDLTIIKQVLLIDGVWMCTRKDVFEKFQFDDITLDGFHGYDIDFCLQVQREYKIVVAFDILLKHLSAGKIDEKYIAQKLKLNHKWRHELPLSIKNLSPQEFREHHWLAMENFMNWLIKLDYKTSFIIKQFFTFSFDRFFSFKPFWKLLTMIFFKKMSHSNFFAFRLYRLVRFKNQ